jgi:hypothetical protein
MHYFEDETLNTVPKGFVDAIISSNPRIRRLVLLHLTDSLLSDLQCLEELEVAFPFPSFSSSALALFLESRPLRRLILPFVDLGLCAGLLSALEKLAYTRSDVDPERRDYLYWKGSSW